MQIDFKRSPPISYTTVLSKYLKKEYDPKNTLGIVQQYGNDLYLLDQYRSECTLAVSDVSLAAVDRHLKYLGHLELIQKLFIFDDNNIKMQCT